MPVSSMKPDAKAEICIDCTGNPGGIGFALDHVYPRGKVILKTTVAKPSKINLNQIVINEIELIGSRCGRFAPALELLASGKIEVERLITSEYSLSEGIAAVEQAQKANSLKVLLSP